MGRVLLKVVQRLLYLVSSFSLRVQVIILGDSGFVVLYFQFFGSWISFCYTPVLGRHPS